MKLLFETFGYFCKYQSKYIPLANALTKNGARMMKKRVESKEKTPNSLFYLKSATRQPQKKKNYPRIADDFLILLKITF